ncbi:YdcF family protein [Amycolatopsis pigmentata]|uniref:YdcF family protein n=1 Tax=Amycolatopsis pigmentata TaxID=450801 RepID=A0ABW5G744_9PSEU
MALGLVALVAVLVFAYRVFREPRRLGNAVWFGVAACLTGLWLLDQVAGISWLRNLALAVLAAIAALIVLVLPWALIANGIVMWRREGHGLANLLSLLAGVALLVVFGATAATAMLGRFPWLTAIALTSLVITGYFAFLFAALLAYSVLYGTFRRERDANAIIVLGAGLLDGRVSPLLAARLDRAIACRKRSATTDPVMVVSGGQGPDEPVSEAEAMGDYLREAGVPAEKILLEDKATSTEENLRFSVAVLAEHGHTGKMVAVTSNYHMFRTAVLARRLRLRLDVMGARTATYFVLSAFLREFAALLAQYWRTNLAAVVLLAGTTSVLTWLHR